MTTLCGSHEECFEKGTCWGHMENVMCKYLRDGGDEYATHFFCKKTQKLVENNTTYFTQKEYEELLKVKDKI